MYDYQGKHTTAYAVVISLALHAGVVATSLWHLAPLRKQDEFAAYAGHLAKIEVMLPVQGRKRFTGSRCASRAPKGAASRVKTPVVAISPPGSGLN